MIELFVIEVVSGGLAVALRPRGGDWLGDELAGLRRRGFTIIVSMLTADEERELELTNERDEAIAAGLEFIAFPISDRSVTTATTAAPVVRRLASAVTNGGHVAVHCRQGIGRSTMIVAAVLVALGRAPADAWAAVTAARGRPVPDTEEQRRWVDELAPLLEKRDDEKRGV